MRRGGVVEMNNILDLPLRIDDDGDLVNDAGFVPDLPEELAEIAHRVNVYDELVAALHELRSRPWATHAHVKANAALRMAEGVSR